MDKAAIERLAKALRGRFDLLVLWAIAAGYERPSGRRYFGCPIDSAAWLGHRPTPAERVALSRTLSRLEEREAGGL